MVEVVKSAVSTSCSVVPLLWEGAGYVPVLQPNDNLGLNLGEKMNNQALFV